MVVIFLLNELYLLLFFAANGNFREIVIDRSTFGIQSCVVDCVGRDKWQLCCNNVVCCCVLLYVVFVLFCLGVYCCVLLCVGVGVYCSVLLCILCVGVCKCMLICVLLCSCVLLCVEVCRWAKLCVVVFCCV